MVRIYGPVKQASDVREQMSRTYSPVLSTWSAIQRDISLMPPSQRRDDDGLIIARLSR